MRFWVVSAGEDYESGTYYMTGHTDRDEAIATAKRVKEPIIETHVSTSWGTVRRLPTNVNRIDWAEVHGFDTEVGAEPFEHLQDHEL